MELYAFYVVIIHLYVLVEKDIMVTALEDSLMTEVSNKELHAEIKDIAVWLCLAFRMPKNGSALMISTGSFVGNTCTMATETLKLNNHPACWVKYLTTQSS